MSPPIFTDYNRSSLLFAARRRGDVSHVVVMMLSALTLLILLRAEGTSGMRINNWVLTSYSTKQVISEMFFQASLLASMKRNNNYYWVTFRIQCGAIINFIRTTMQQWSTAMHNRDRQKSNKTKKTRMWANAQRDGRPAEHRWRPLFNAANFGWRPLLDCRAVTLPRRESHWN